ncbi:hypothetical protein [Lysinibacillus sp. NPDC086135]|uniref:hypothetical protein n=1 Tax=Lysinibacillus sp. NPDC086135 TaxID=3364130 RepID=UPI00382946C3
MAQFSFDVEFRTDRTNSLGQPITEFEIVVYIKDPIIGELIYPMSVSYINGSVIHDVQKLENEFPPGQLRREMISNMKTFIKSEI